MASSDSSQGETWSFLNGDAQESARPVAQHEWLKELLAFDINPTIPIPAGPPAEVGDNTEARPDCGQLWGFDILTAQFPAPEMRPSNLQLHEHDVTKPFPEKYHGTFDIVAVRLITEGLRALKRTGTGVLP
ncbi:hypothetical protein QBC37DRAFT_447597 [Rhypophila decipiens]|uniref:Uncharacterized protein n=1 Tax=Rhypophila decipiens TaxID=261697 RepID=A0AAN6Y3T2_9PEZI|nr:hypothetical protein QBC37DRAFT_447597 [Rhypophila decipiens]